MFGLVLTDAKFGVDESVTNVVDVACSFSHLLCEGNVLHMLCLGRHTCSVKRDHLMLVRFPKLGFY